MFTVTYPLILEHHTMYFSTAEWKVGEGAQCLHAVKEDWGCPVLHSPEVGSHMCSHHYPCWRDFNYSLLLILRPITPMQRIPTSDPLEILGTQI